MYYTVAVSLSLIKSEQNEEKGCEINKLGDHVSMKSETCGCVKTLRPVNTSQFGEFVSEHHDHGNKMFRDNFEVQHSLTHTHSKLCTCKLTI